MKFKKKGPLLGVLLGAGLNLLNFLRETSKPESGTHMAPRPTG
jgi:hypothetical protein